MPAGIQQTSVVFSPNDPDKLISTGPEAVYIWTADTQQVMTTAATVERLCHLAHGLVPVLPGRTAVPLCITVMCLTHAGYGETVSSTSHPAGV